MRISSQLRTGFLLALGLCCTSLRAQTGSTAKPGATEQDPFAGVTTNAKPEGSSETSARSGLKRFFTDNLGFRKEIMSQFDTTDRGRPASRQSLGFEVL